MKKHINLLLILSGALCSCNNQPSAAKPEPTSYTQLAMAKQLLGNWQNQFPEGVAAESWEQLNDSTYAGKSFVVMGADTVSSETLVLQQRGKEVLYIPTVKDQNNGESVSFLLTSLNDKQLVFENPKHDFPQKISYTFISNDSVVAEISGNIDGKPKAEQFPMKRVK
ncbi:MAG: DUF6265 family protein [Bacteroidota bacterium]